MNWKRINISKYQLPSLSFRLSAFCFLLFALCFLLASCKKDSFITSADARLHTSVDSVKFDTVFTSTGNVTHSFKIFNDNNQKLLLSKVKLMGGVASSYKININGTATNELTNVELAANDSIYVFVTVTVNPNAANQPFIVKDSILINYNNNNKYVQLEAYGQNAIYLKNAVVTGNTVWTKTKPYVILGSLRVDTTATLTMQAGTRVYSHADAPFLIDGTLIANGTVTEPIVFRGDRLDAEYKDLPAGWPGIYFRSTSKNNALTFAQILNAYQALVVTNPSVNANPKLDLRQSLVDNAYDAGLVCINTNINGSNSLFSNCGNDVVISLGGTYNFTHCTMASFSNNYISHKNPVLQVSNYAIQGATVFTNNLAATFTNTIIWGDTGFVQNDVVVAKQGSNTFNVNFANCLYRANTDPTNATITTCIKNQYPQFDSIDVVKRIFNFRVNNTVAPGVNKGTSTLLLKDLDDKQRTVGSFPDIGCYEKQ